MLCYGTTCSVNSNVCKLYILCTAVTETLILPKGVCTNVTISTTPPSKLNNNLHGKRTWNSYIEADATMVIDCDDIDILMIVLMYKPTISFREYYLLILKWRSLLTQILLPYGLQTVWENESVTIYQYFDDASLLVPEKIDVQINDEFQNILKLVSPNKLTVNMVKTKESFHRPNPRKYVPPDPMPVTEEVIFVK